MLAMLSSLESKGVFEYTSAMNSLEQRIEDVLDSKVRPALARHKGNTKVLRVEDGTVFVEMTGMCVGCGAAQMTVKLGIEAALKEYIPEIERVVAV